MSKVALAAISPALLPAAVALAQDAATAKTLLILVAGAGFEPATFGL
ncbi:MAG TPA: hypothetical protein VGC50_14425 [Gammaproteobacteria bacterium]